MGQKIPIETLKQVQGDYTLNLSSLPSGVYFYRILNEDGSLVGSGKLLIKK